MKIGVLGAGNIAGVVSRTLSAMEEVQCYAVAARSLERAQTFAAEHGFQKAYGSYEELVSDPDVELVYVATPHVFHYEHMLLAMEHGKAVICEKSFCINAKLAEKIRDVSREKGVYAAEAIWTRYMPSRQMLLDVMNSGIVGKITNLTANLSYYNAFKPRIQDPALAGGALLDLGVYGLNFALMAFGNDLERIESSVQLMPTGVDGMESISLFWKDGRMAVLNHSTYCRSDRQGILHGENGYIVVSNINNPQRIEVYDTQDNLLERHEVPQQISGYEYEFREAVRCIRAGKTESESMPLEESIFVLGIMDALRRQWGVVFPQEC